MKCCPACGQTLPVASLQRARLANKERRLYEIIHKSNGITAAACFERLYTGEDGGPDSGPSIISVMVRNINIQIRKDRQRIVSTRGPGALYSVIAVRPDIKNTPAQIEEIRQLYFQGRWTQGQLAKKFGCSQSQISLAVNYSNGDVLRKALNSAQEIGKL